MLLKNLVDEDFVNYRKPSLFLIFPFCSFKCDKEYGTTICQNWPLAQAPNIEIAVETIIQRYLKNPITKAVVCGGLEPFDSWDDLKALIKEFRKHTIDDFCIYTGYNFEEIRDKVEYLKNYPNIIIKFGRYIPNSLSLYDEVLGIELASNNQYAEKIS